ncbi:MAG: hypothetical protein HYZ15_03065 [Sphingobacteriales bacterium]|nr:hypothetical protein [Sphingobacteriales bacterium]
MFKLTNLRKSGFILPAPVWIALLLQSSLLISCADNKRDPGSTATAKNEFKMNCVTLTKAQMQAWVDSGWTKPGSPGRIKTLLLQFTTLDAGGIKSNMQLTAYPGSSVTEVKLTGNTLLAIDNSCPAKTFSGRLILANNETNIDSLNLVKPDGTLRNFDFIRFIPQQYSINSAYITFRVEIVTDGKVEGTAPSGTYPCPPYCCPPDCQE